MSDGSISWRTLANRAARGARWLVPLVVAVCTAAGCDPYDCAEHDCADGRKWQQCIACSGTAGTECTVQARDEQGHVLSDCTYAPTNGINDPGRTRCFDQARAAGAAFCGR